MYNALTFAFAGLRCSMPTESCLNQGRCEATPDGNGECRYVLTPAFVFLAEKKPRRMPAQKCWNVGLWRPKWLRGFLWLTCEGSESSHRWCYFWEANGRERNEWTLMRTGVTVWCLSMFYCHHILLSLARTLAVLNLVFLFFRGATAGFTRSSATIVLRCD